MPMPDGIVSVRIAKDTGCPARAGQLDTTWEVFREGHVPECENVEDLPDIFNDTSGIEDRIAGEDGEEEDEPLF